MDLLGSLLYHFLDNVFLTWNNNTTPTCTAAPQLGSSLASGSIVASQ